MKWPMCTQRELIISLSFSKTSSHLTELISQRYSAKFGWSGPGLFVSVSLERALDKGCGGTVQICRTQSPTSRLIEASRRRPQTATSVDFFC